MNLFYHHKFHFTRDYRVNIASLRPEPVVLCKRVRSWQQLQPGHQRTPPRATRVQLAAGALEKFLTARSST